MFKNPMDVTVDTVRRVNEQRILSKKAGVVTPQLKDFLGRPIEISLEIDRTEWKRAWKAVRERSARA